MDLLGDVFWGGENSPNCSSPVVTESSLGRSSPLSHVAAETSVFHDLSLFAMDGIEFLPFDAMENELQTFGELGSKSNVASEKSGENLGKSLEEDIEWHKLLISDSVTVNINDLQEESRYVEDFDVHIISGTQQLQTFGELDSNNTVSLEKSGENQGKSPEEDIEWQRLLVSDLITDHIENINDLREASRGAEDFDVHAINDKQQTAESAVLTPNGQSESLYSIPVYQCMFCSRTFLIQDELYTHYPTCYILFAEVNDNNVMLPQNEEVSINIQDNVTVVISPENTGPDTLAVPSTIEHPKSSTTDTLTAGVVADGKIDVQSDLLPEVFEYMKKTFNESHVSQKAKRRRSFKVVYACSICSETFRYKHPLKCHLRKHTMNRRKISHRMSDRTKNVKLNAENQQSTPKQTISLPIQGSKHSSSIRSETLKLHPTEHQLTPKQAVCLPVHNSKRFKHSSETRSDTLKLHAADHQPALNQAVSLPVQGSQRSKDSSAKVRSFSCSICDREFSRASGLRQHYQIHSGEKPYKCAVCLFSCSQRSNLKRHIESHEKFSKPFNCTDCNRKFATKEDIEYHHFIRHTKKKAKITPPSLSEPYLSTSKTAPNADINGVPTEQIAGGKNGSQQTKTPSINPLQTVKKSKSRSGEKSVLTCGMCSMKFRNRSHLFMHVRTHSSKRSFVCTLCQASFKQPTTLNNHMKTHGMEMPYPCTDCKMGFYSPSYLRAHVRRCHTAIHLCAYCGIMLDGMSQLRVHERTHTKPYKCEICTFSSGQLTNLKCHIDTHQQCLKPFTCTDCNRKFAAKEDLEAHIKKPKRKAKIATSTLSTSKTQPSAEMNGGSTEEVAEGEAGSQETAPERLVIVKLAKKNS